MIVAAKGVLEVGFLSAFLRPSTKVSMLPLGVSGMWKSSVYVSFGFLYLPYQNAHGGQLDNKAWYKAMRVLTQSKLLGFFRIMDRRSPLMRR